MRLYIVVDFGYCFIVVWYISVVFFWFQRLHYSKVVNLSDCFSCSNTSLYY